MGTLCITLDIDWAHDAIVHDALDLLAAHGVTATLFVTHKTVTMDRMRALGHELGVHPNFNPILDGAAGDAAAVLDPLLELVPEAVSVRSHSLSRSSRLAQLFASRGLTHESNILLPQGLGDVGLWYDFSGLIQVPIRWEDDVYAIQPPLGPATLGLAQCSVHVCDFQPIHLFLNTVDITDYERTRAIHNDPQALVHHRRPLGSGGARDQFLCLVDASDRTNDRLICAVQPMEAGT